MTRFFTKCLGLLCMAVLCCFSFQDAAAQCVSGETEVTLDISPSGFPAEISWELLGCNDEEVDSRSFGSYSTGTSSSNNYCLKNGVTYTFNAFDSFGDGWNGGTATMTETSNSSNIYFSFFPVGSSDSETFIPAAGIASGCLDETAHNYDASACGDDGSCETCDDGVQNGDEIDVDCGGELCELCPCGIQVETEVAVYESGCATGPKNRVVLVTFTDGIPPISYDIDAQGGSLVSQKAPGVFQIIGYGPWSIEASDPSGCLQVGTSADMVYVSDTEAKKETAANAGNGTATIEVTGGKPPYSILWSDGEEGTIAASGGTHDNTGLATGYYEAVVTDDVGEIAKACIYVGRNAGRGSRGRGRKTADVTDLNTLMAQPNPLTHSTMIHFNVPESTKTTVSVFALNGKEIVTVFDGQAEAGENYHVELNASNMASGVYILRLTTDSGVVSHQRIVVTK